jgi:hypothetical protein
MCQVLRKHWNMLDWRLLWICFKMIRQLAMDQEILASFCPLCLSRLTFAIKPLSRTFSFFTDPRPGHWNTQLMQTLTTLKGNDSEPRVWFSNGIWSMKLLDQPLAECSFLLTGVTTVQSSVLSVRFVKWCEDYAFDSVDIDGKYRHTNITQIRVPLDFAICPDSLRKCYLVHRSFPQNQNVSMRTKVDQTVPHETITKSTNNVKQK